MKSLSSLRISALATALALLVPAIHAADAPSLSAKFVGVSNADQNYDRFIITYKPGTSERDSSAAVLQNVITAIGHVGLNNATMSVNGTTTPALSASYQRKLAMGADLIRTSRKLSQSEANTLMAQIASDPAVAHVQPDRMLHAVQDFKAPASLGKPTDAPTPVAPNDTYYADYQWNFSNAVGGANVNNAWNIADGTGVTVAVIDTGITQHPDLDTSLGDAGYDFIDDHTVSGRAVDGRVPGGWDTGDWTTRNECGAGTAAENSSWHGTNVAGVIGELTDNNMGMAGIAYNAKVLPIRVLGHCGGYDSDISDAIEWASGGHVDGVPDNTHIAQVISMSLGGEDQCAADDPEYQAIQDALGRGTAVVVAAGNSSANVSGFTPASCPGVIAVAANGITGKRAFYSNYGNGITLSAPGGGIYANDASSGTQVNEGFIWQALNLGTTSPIYPADPVQAYGGMAGTSQATPHVTGAVAMIVGAVKAAGLPALTPAQITNILVKSARAFPVTEDQPIGAGILDAYAAVNLALGNDNGGGDNGGDNGGEQPIVLTKGSLLSGQSASSGSILYSIVVPSGATTLNIRTLGGSGNVAMYVKAGTAPAADGSDADFSSVKPGTSEAVVIAQPQATTYYIRVAASQGIYSNISVLADYNP
ncbi:S8 family serine peptidase [Dyella caseinilytica]|uniref:S8 family serine peptidase n=1 Tax=Dyella caseinilytica TaxID=1849581 RepID=A0ABX7GVH6_9GAMM|nr:S8 family serine peptidase [Dyella caseinilytica]QRN54445.1 S8 family serine peptidase [Dyella caseinilytica]GFZ94294.1 protease [Dyella caseinilytica]